MALENISTHLISLLTLTGLEVVLGVDNLILISLLSSQLPISQQKKARQIGLLLALMGRVLLLSSVLWLSRLKTPVFQVFEYAFSFNDVLLIGGGTFLIYKGAQAISNEFEGEKNQQVLTKHTFFPVISQILVFDIIFSLDSILTAVGLTSNIWVLYLAIGFTVTLMLLASGPLSKFVKEHPSVRMLALSFLLLVGTILIADGFAFHIPRGYVYFAFFFSSLVIGLNIIISKRKRS